jgi:hypothetical protein
MLVNGDWPDDEFLIVPPGHTLAASMDDGVIRVDPPAP